MPDCYRAFFLSSEGRLNRPSVVLDVASDEAAIEAARPLLDGHDVEVWFGSRLVKHLPKVEPS